MSKMMKRMFVLFLALFVVFSFSVSALAETPGPWDYNFDFVDNTAELHTSLNAMKITRDNGAYVRARYDSIRMMFVLQQPGVGTLLNSEEFYDNRAHFRPGSDDWATDMLTNVSTAGYHYFTYRFEYGSNQFYYLTALPYATSFDPFTISGEWDS